MIMYLFRPALAACLAAATIAGAMHAGPPFAQKAESGQSLVVSAEHRDLGPIYHALPGRDVQVSFFSTAPAEDIEGNSDAVIGYAVAGPADQPAALRAGEWHLPVNSLRTGIRNRDRHLTESSWLDAANYPDIVFQLKEVADISDAKHEGDIRAFTATLKGDMTIRGVTRAVEIPGATIAFRAAGPATEAVAQGDLLSIRARYDIALADYGVQNRVIGHKVAEVIKVDTNLILSTVPPEDQPPAKAKR